MSTLNPSDLYRVVEAKKRIWVMLSKAENYAESFAENLVVAASKGVDVRIIANNVKAIANTMNRFIQNWNNKIKNINEQIKRVKRKIMENYISFGIIIAIALMFLALSLYIMHVSENPIGSIPLLGTLDIRSARVMAVLAPFLGLFGILHFFVVVEPETKWRKSLERDLAKLLQIVEERKATLRQNLNIIEAPVTDELVVIDDRAWAKNDGMFVEIDVNEAERKFMKLWISRSKESKDP